LAAYGDDEEKEGEEQMKEDVAHIRVTVQTSTTLQQAKEEPSQQQKRRKRAGQQGEGEEVTLSPRQGKKKGRAQGRSEEAVVSVKLPPPPADLFLGGNLDSNRRERKEEHLGRIRSFPHTEGNYPTFVYIPVHIDKVKGLVHRADALLEQIRSWLPDHRVYPISETREGPPNSSEATSRPLELIYHVSISRTVGVRQHQIEPLIDLLRSSLATAPSFEASFGAEYEVFTNDEHTRSFFSLSIIEGKEKAQVCWLINQVDAVFKQFRLPGYYEVWLMCACARSLKLTFGFSGPPPTYDNWLGPWGCADQGSRAALRTQTIGHTSSCQGQSPFPLPGR